MNKRLNKWTHDKKIRTQTLKYISKRLNIWTHDKKYGNKR